MCDSPIRLKNPNYGLKVVGANKFKDCTSQYINVPCGHCKPCIYSRQMNIVSRVQMESLCSYLFYITLTYQSSALPYIISSSGERFAYAEVSDIQNMIKRLRASNLLERPFKYLCVSEFGSSRGRPHFHMILSVPKYSYDDKFTAITLETKYWSIILNEWKRKIGTSRKFASYLPLLIYKCKKFAGRTYRNYDLHLMTDKEKDDSCSNVTFYVTKYMLKESKRSLSIKKHLLDTYSLDEAKLIWSTIKPRVFKSIDFGFEHESESYKSPINEYLRSCVRRSRDAGSKFPMYYNPFSGKTCPMPVFYRKKGCIYNVDDAQHFYDVNQFSNDTLIDSSDVSSSTFRNGESLDFLMSDEISTDFLDYVEF